MTVSPLGSATGTASTTTIALTIGATGVAVGEHIIVAAGSGANTVTIDSVADSKGNTYTRRAHSPAASSCAIFDSPCTVALVATDTITVTYSAGTASRSISAIKADNLSSSPFDQTGAAAGTGVGTAPTVSTAGATAQADELLVGVAAHRSTLGTDWTQSNGETEFLDAVVNTRGHVAAHLTVASVGVKTFAPDFTSGDSATWTAAVATFKIASASIAPQAMHQRRMRAA